MTNDGSYDDTITAYDTVQEVVEQYESVSLEAFSFHILAAYFVSNSAIIDQTFFTLLVGVPVIVFSVACIVRHIRATLYVFLMIFHL